MLLFCMFHFPFPAILSLFSPPVTYCKQIPPEIMPISCCWCSCPSSLHQGLGLLQDHDAFTYVFQFRPKNSFVLLNRPIPSHKITHKLQPKSSHALSPSVSALTPPLEILAPLPTSGCHLSVPYRTVSTVGSNKFPPPPKCLINSCLLNVYFTSNPRGNRKI